MGKSSRNPLRVAEGDDCGDDGDDYSIQIVTYKTRAVYGFLAVSDDSDDIFLYLRIHREEDYGLYRRAAHIHGSCI
jgi:hypothetical protein